MYQSQTYQTIFTLLKVFVRAKNRCLCCFLFSYFRFVSWFLLDLRLCVLRIFLLKKINRLEIVLITSFHYTTDFNKSYQSFLLASGFLDGCFFRCQSRKVTSTLRSRLSVEFHLNRLFSAECVPYGIRTLSTIGQHVRSLIPYPFGHRPIRFELN